MPRKRKERRSPDPQTDLTDSQLSEGLSMNIFCLETLQKNGRKSPALYVNFEPHSASGTCNEKCT